FSLKTKYMPHLIPSCSVQNLDREHIYGLAFVKSKWKVLSTLAVADASSLEISSNKTPNEKNLTAQCTCLSLV
ncbi:hypothetical protein Q8G50_31760, partial [Klebsiella pneumoniae]